MKQIKVLIVWTCFYQINIWNPSNNVQNLRYSMRKLFVYRKPSNNAPGILTETYKIPFSGKILRRTYMDMRKIKILLV